jgi:hypothetical protein
MTGIDTKDVQSGISELAHRLLKKLPVLSMATSLAWFSRSQVDINSIFFF